MVRLKWMTPYIEFETKMLVFLSNIVKNAYTYQTKGVSLFTYARGIKALVHCSLHIFIRLFERVKIIPKPLLGHALTKARLCTKQYKKEPTPL
jgi:hypothetical protein